MSTTDVLSSIANMASDSVSKADGLISLVTKELLAHHGKLCSIDRNRVCFKIGITPQQADAHTAK